MVGLVLSTEVSVSERSGEIFQSHIPNLKAALKEQKK